MTVHVTHITYIGANMRIICMLSMLLLNSTSHLSFKLITFQHYWNMLTKNNMDYGSIQFAHYNRFVKNPKSAGKIFQTENNFSLPC